MRQCFTYTVVVSPENFGAISGADCTDAFDDMADFVNSSMLGGVTIEFTPGAEYKIWPAGESTPIACTFTGVDGLTIRFNGARITTDNEFGGGQTQVFHFEDCTNVSVDKGDYEETAWTALSDTAGAHFFYITGSSKNLIFTNIKQDGGTGGVVCAGTDQFGVGGDVEDVTVLNARFDNVFYGINLQGSGDNFFGRNIQGNNNGRLFFPWNVSGFDVTLAGNGGAANSQVLLKCYGMPAASDHRRTLSGRVRYRNHGRVNATAASPIVLLSAAQAVAPITVSAVADNGSGKARFTVNSTAAAVSGQKWFVSPLGGFIAANNTVQTITVIDATHVDLPSVNYAGGYTSGGSLSVPINIDVDADLDIVADSNQQACAFATSKENSAGSADSGGPRGVTIDLTLIGSIKGYDYGIRALDLWGTAGLPSNGAWTGESINAKIDELTIAGTNTTVVVDATSTSRMLLRGLRSNANLILTGGNTGTALIDVDTANVKHGLTIGGAADLQPSYKAKVQAVDVTTNSVLAAGQSATNGVVVLWEYNATPSLGRVQFATFGYSNPIFMDGSALNLGQLSSCAVNIYNGGVAPVGTGAYVRKSSPALVTPDIGAATGASLSLTGVMTLPNNVAYQCKDIGGTARNVMYLDGSNNLIFDSVNATNINFRISGSTVLNYSSGLGGTSVLGLYSNHATLGMGYSAGAGGTVTQLTSKSTGVTLNKVTGQITMHNAALASGARVSFTLTNSAIAATDVVVVNIKSGATTNSYQLGVDAVAAGSCVFQLYNGSGGSLGEAIVLQFAVIKGVNA